MHFVQYFTSRYGNGRPDYPVMPEGEIKDLAMFVGPSSWSFLKIIGSSGEFLNKVNVDGQFKVIYNIKTAFLPCSLHL